MHERTARAKDGPEARRFRPQRVAATPADAILALQRSAGNRAVASIMRQAAPAAEGLQTYDIPVTFVATPIEDKPQEYVKGWSEQVGEQAQRSGGAAGAVANVAAHGEHGFTRAAAGRLATWQYWSPMAPGTGPRNGVLLERAVDVLPRDLAPRVREELARERARLAAQAEGRPHGNLANPADPQGTELSWTDASRSEPYPTFTRAQIENVPELVRKLHAGEASAEELELLARMAERHISGASSGSPMVSYTLPGKETSVGTKRWRVQVEIDTTVTLDVSSPETPVAKRLQVSNPAETEVIAVTDDALRILSVEKSPGSMSGFVMRNARAIRWAGRGMVVISAGMSAAHVINAPEGHRGEAVAEEAASQALGFGGAALASAICIGLGVSTGGVGLLVCGLAGGIGGGVAGAMLGKELFGPDAPRSDAGGTPIGTSELPTGPDPADPFGLGLQLGGPAQSASLLDFLATPDASGQLSSNDYRVIQGWLGR